MNKTLPTLEQMTDILDIKGVPGVDLLWVWVLAGSLLASALGYLIFYLWKRYRERYRGAGPVQSPLEIALQKLDDLVTSRLVESGQVRRFYFSLSDLFREFIEREMALKAQEATLEELRGMLKEAPDVRAEERKDAIWLLELADMAKFAKFIPSRDEIIRSVKVCRLWMIGVAERRAPALHPETEKAAS